MISTSYAFVVPPVREQYLAPQKVWAGSPASRNARTTSCHTTGNYAQRNFQSTNTDVVEDTQMSRAAVARPRLPDKHLQFRAGVWLPCL